MSAPVALAPNGNEFFKTLKKFVDTQVAAMEHQKKEVKALERLRNALWHAAKPMAERNGLVMGPQAPVSHKYTDFHHDVRETIVSECAIPLKLARDEKFIYGAVRMRLDLEEPSMHSYVEGLTARAAWDAEFDNLLNSFEGYIKTHKKPNIKMICTFLMWDKECTVNYGLYAIDPTSLFPDSVFPLDRDVPPDPRPVPKKRKTVANAAEPRASKKAKKEV